MFYDTDYVIPYIYIYNILETGLPETANIMCLLVYVIYKVLPYYLVYDLT